jgi:hypothetical protein
MATELSSARVWRLWKESKSIAAVAVYEDSSTRVRVEEFCRELGRELGERCDLAKEMWPISELRVPQLRTIASTEASKADLVIVSVHCGESLPDEMKAWLEGLLKHKPRRHGVLLGLFDPVYNGPSSALQATLKTVAEKGGMEFLAQTDDSPQD